jgi:hypothetical protein
VSSIRTNFEGSRCIGSRATAPETDASDHLINPIGWLKSKNHPNPNLNLRFARLIKTFVLSSQNLSVSLNIFFRFALRAM